MNDESWLEGLRKHQQEWERYTKAMGRVMKCCGQSGVELWDNESQRYRCSSCNAPTSTDYSYMGYPPATLDSVIKPKQADPDAKCICTIQTLMAKGCRCGGK